MDPVGLHWPDDHVHDQEVPYEADDAHDHVDNHDGDLHPGGQQGVGLIIGFAEVVGEQRAVVELQVPQLSQQEVVGELHLEFLPPADITTAQLGFQLWPLSDLIY